MITIVTDPKGFLSFDHPRNLTYRSLNLLTVEQIQALPNGTLVQCFNGMPAVVGQHHIDLDTRAGFTAFGFYAERPGQTFYIKRCP